MRTNEDQRRLEAFGDRVRGQREARGLSQEAFAAEIGVHRTYVGGIERGERNITLVVLWRLAEGLGITAADLLASS